MKKITFRITSDDKESAFSINLTNKTFSKTKHIILRNIEEIVYSLLNKNKHNFK